MTSSNPLKPFTNYYDTYELREAAFAQRVGHLLPDRLRGAGVFWKDFSRITASQLDALAVRKIACMTSNARDTLVFATPWQTLVAAARQQRDGKPDQARRLNAIVARFDLQELLHQPLRTLSGGESVRLALARICLILPQSRAVVIASPYSWLSQHNTHYLGHVMDACGNYGISPELLALTGEDAAEPFRVGQLSEALQAPPPGFDLRLDNLRINLGLALDSLFQPCAQACVRDAVFRLQSPCLLVGENGQGKSLIAKALAGAVNFSGQAEIAISAAHSRPRLLFQDVISQTLLRDFASLAGPHHDAAQVLYRELQQCYDAAGRSDQAVATPIKALLELKLMLTAVRLCLQPAALILDEPDWGLSRLDSLAFTTAVIVTAHKRGVAVLLISHKPWWQPLARSILQVRRQAPEASREARCRFGVSLEAV